MVSQHSFKKAMSAQPELSQPGLSVGQCHGTMTIRLTQRPQRLLCHKMRHWH